MDQHLFELALLRSIERLIGVLLAGLTIWLGYRLFMNIPQATEGSAEVEVPGTGKIMLTRIAPGVFFALFGVIVIGISFYKSVHIGDVYAGVSVDSLKRDSTIRPVSRNEVYVGAAEEGSLGREAQESQRAEVRRAIRTLNQTLLKAPAQERVTLRASIETSKFALIYLIWQKEWGQPDAFRNWLNERGAMPPSFKEPFALFELTGS